jgi:hypothetical protein
MNDVTQEPQYEAAPDDPGTGWHGVITRFSIRSIDLLPMLHPGLRQLVRPEFATIQSCFAGSARCCARTSSGHAAALRQGDELAAPCSNASSASISRPVVAVAITMEASFCVGTEDAMARHVKPEIFNTDQGSQFIGSVAGEEPQPRTVPPPPGSTGEPHWIALS